MITTPKKTYLTAAISREWKKSNNHPKNNQTEQQSLNKLANSNNHLTAIQTAPITQQPTRATITQQPNRATLT